MEKQQYKVVLTGELLPGFTQQTATQAMAEIFQISSDAVHLIFEGGEHPINERFSADEALDLQTRLEQIGVGSKIERLPARVIDMRLRQEPLASTAASAAEPKSTPSEQAGMMHCPACGQEQQVSKSCTACGVVFSEFNQQRATGGAKIQPQEKAQPAQLNKPPGSGPMNTHPQDNWHEAWGEFDDIDEPGEEYHLSLFFGEKADYFQAVCDRYMKGPRTRFALGWNWSAVFSPFIWVMYRKMWGWGALIFIAEILLPAMLITLGSYDPLSSHLTYLGLGLLVVNRLFWPAVVNYLYCSHARSSVQQLHMMAPNYATEIDIATAGGVSAVSVLVGLALAGVLSVLLLSIVASVDENERFLQEQHLFRESGGSEFTGYEGIAEKVDSVTGIRNVKNLKPPNKWVMTRSKLRSLGQKINNWIAQRAEQADTTQLNLFRLRQELSLQPVELQDGWGGDVQYIPDMEGYRLISAGPDKLFGTADDIQYRRTLTK